MPENNFNQLENQDPPAISRLWLILVVILIVSLGVAVFLFLKQKQDSGIVLEAPVEEVAVKKEEIKKVEEVKEIVQNQTKTITAAEPLEEEKENPSASTTSVLLDFLSGKGNVSASEQGKTVGLAKMLESAASNPGNQVQPSTAKKTPVDSSALKALMGVTASLSADSDGDGLTDIDEKSIYHTDPSKADTDGDGYNDSTEVKKGNNPLGKNVDTDKDGLVDYQETYVYHTDPNKADTDGDGYNDGAEVKGGHDPLLR